MADLHSGAGSGPCAVAHPKQSPALLLLGAQRRAQLRAYDVRRMGGALSVKISTSWPGGVLGTAYTIDVVWEFDEANHSSVVIVSDDAW